MKENEEKTLLYGGQTAQKCDPQIMFRGEIDSLHARAVYVCAYAKQYGYHDVISGTEDIVRVTRELMRAEAMKEEPQVDAILGIALPELRKISHHPKSELGTEHYLPDENTDVMTAQLNLLRTDVRRAERCACAAGGENPVCKAMCMVLNRLSSAVYILMLENRISRMI